MSGAAARTGNLQQGKIIEIIKRKMIIRKIEKCVKQEVKNKPRIYMSIVGKAVRGCLQGCS